MAWGLYINDSFEDGRDPYKVLYGVGMSARCDRGDTPSKLMARVQIPVGALYLADRSRQDPPFGEYYGSRQRTGPDGGR